MRARSVSPIRPSVLRGAGLERRPGRICSAGLGPTACSGMREFPRASRARISGDLLFVTEENAETIGEAMTHVEKMRLAACPASPCACRRTSPRSKLLQTPSKGEDRAGAREVGTTERILKLYYRWSNHRTNHRAAVKGEDQTADQDRTNYWHTCPRRVRLCMLCQCMYTHCVFVALTP
jgi:hypothetical protein